MKLPHRCRRYPLKAGPRDKTQVSLLQARLCGSVHDGKPLYSRRLAQSTSPAYKLPSNVEALQMSEHPAWSSCSSHRLLLLASARRGSTPEEAATYFPRMAFFWQPARGLSCRDLCGHHKSFSLVGYSVLSDPWEHLHTLLTSVLAGAMRSFSEPSILSSWSYRSSTCMSTTLTCSRSQELQSSCRLCINGQSVTSAPYGITILLMNLSSGQITMVGSLRREGAKVQEVIQRPC